MSKFNKEWKVKQVTKDQLNDQLYAGVDPLLNPHISTEITHSRAYDAKLLIRELVDNIYDHDTAFSINLEVEVVGTKVVFTIKHNGSAFDPFSANSKCALIKKIKDDISFTPSLSLTDSSKRVIKISFDLL